MHRVERAEHRRAFLLRFEFRGSILVGLRGRTTLSRGRGIAQVAEAYKLTLTVDAPVEVGVNSVRAEVRSRGVDQTVVLDATPAELGQAWFTEIDLPPAPRMLNLRLVCDDGEVTRVCYQIFHLPDDLEEGTLAVQLVGREGGVWGVLVDDEGVPPLSVQFLWGFVLLTLAGWLFARRIRRG